MGQRTTYLLKTYLLTVAIFVAAKPAFMLFNHEGHVFTLRDVASVVGHGLSLDLSTALYVVLLPLLAAAVSLWWKGGSLPLRRLLKGYYAALALALALAFVADTSLYAFWGFKLNAVCLQYLATPAEAVASVSGNYLLWRLAVLAVLTVLIYRAYVRRLPLFRPARHRLRSTLVGVLLLPLLVIGIRGGVDESTTNVGQVYYAQDQFLNHSAVNPVFSFLASFEHSQDDYSGYDFFDEATLDSLMAGVYSTESVGCDTLLRTNRPDVVVIIMEGAGEEFASAMPHLQQLKREGVYFAQCYANSWRTDRGTVSTLSGWPSFPNVSVMKMPEKSQTMPSIARTLKAQGYATSFLYGGDINFTNMRSYLVATGWERLMSKDDYDTGQQRTAKWGVRDDITFGTLATWLAEGRRQPRLFGYLTLSSHEPWDVPVRHDSDEMLNAFRYLDDCLGRFVEQLRHTPQWEHTLVVVLPDHGVQYKGYDETNPERNRIPVVWAGGAVKAPRRIDTICNQSDVAATLLGQLGLEHADFTFSRDVLSTTYRRHFAVHNYNNAQSMVDPTGFILYDFDARRYVVNRSDDADNMLNLSKAILQTTTNDLKLR